MLALLALALLRALLEALPALYCGLLEIALHSFHLDAVMRGTGGGLLVGLAGLGVAGHDVVVYLF